MRLCSPARRRLTLGRDRDLAPREVGESLDEVAIDAHAAVHAQLTELNADFGFCRVEQIGAALGDAVEHRPHEMGSRGAAGESEERAARAKVPTWCAEAREGRHKGDAIRCGDARRKFLGLADRRHEAELFEPFDA